MGKRIRGAKAVKLRKEFLRDQPLCVDCLEENIFRAADVVDHKVPLSLGGTEDSSNKRALCHEHHRRRTREQFGWKTRKLTLVDGNGWPIHGS
jgi:5-methylcytosine-specific restriction protein A